MIWKLTTYAQQYRIYFEQVNQRALTLYVEPVPIPYDFPIDGTCQSASCTAV